MLLDQDNSGQLSPLELRCSIMAFSQMGIIAEEINFKPVDVMLEPWQEKVPRLLQPSAEDRLTGQHRSNQFVQGYFEDLSSTRSRLHLSPGMLLDDYPINLHRGQVVILGDEGVDLVHPGAWTICVDFRLDPARASKQENRGETFNYSILVSSYRNNCIAAKLVRPQIDGSDTLGLKTKYGVQFIFIDRSLLKNPATVQQRIQESELTGECVLSPVIEIEEDAW